MEAGRQRGGETGGGGPFQYSLRTMFIVMTVLAVALSGIFAGPEWLSMLTALFLALATPIVLTIALIYGGGYLRTFCIGALFPAGLILFSLGPGLSYPFFGMGRFGGSPGGEVGLYVAIFVLVAGIVIVVLGLLAIGVRWMVEAPQRRRQEAALRAETPQSSGSEAATAADS